MRSLHFSLPSNQDGLDFEEVIDLFTPTFMNRYTKFSSIEEFFKTGGYTVTSMEHLIAILGDDFDSYINQHTDYSCWEDLLGMANIFSFSQM